MNRDLKDKAKKESTLLSVPNPRIREPAKGGLPPIPDFVEKLTIGELSESICVVYSIFIMILLSH